MGTGIGTPLGDRVRPGGAFGPCLLTSNMASATTAIRPVASLAVAGWLAACVAPLVLAGCVAAPIALVCYLAVAVQVSVHLRRLGTFGSLVALAYPVALTVFLVVCARSLVLTYGLGRVSWKGRSLPTR